MIKKVQVQKLLQLLVFENLRGIISPVSEDKTR